tara:strand:+ start:90 stop:281 length:192 start_codon:yes stop_codon:yes gene_type:complete
MGLGERGGCKHTAYLRLLSIFVGVVYREWGVLIALITAVWIVEARCRWLQTRVMRGGADFWNM